MALAARIAVISLARNPNAATTMLATVAFTIVLGAFLGLGLFTFGYARGASYVTNDPAACGNGHVMSQHFAAWMKSSHRQSAAGAEAPAGVMAAASSIQRGMSPPVVGKAYRCPPNVPACGHASQALRTAS